MSNQQSDNKKPETRIVDGEYRVVNAKTTVGEELAAIFRSCRAHPILTTAGGVALFVAAAGLVSVLKPIVEDGLPQHSLDIARDFLNEHGYAIADDRPVTPQMCPDGHLVFARQMTVIRKDTDNRSIKSVCYDVNGPRFPYR